jgi:hypothetical protein
MGTGFWSKGLDPDMPIYRIHPKRFLKSLLAGKLHLPATYRWTDPFENLLALASYVVRTSEGLLETKCLEGGRLPTFGQCWTTISESDAMWRIYSRVQNTKRVNHTFFPHEGVRLSTTARKLVNSLADGMGWANRDNCYITAMKYFTESDLTQYGQFLTSPRDCYIQPLPSSLRNQWTKPERQIPSSILAITDTDDDRVPFIALDPFQVLDEKPFALIRIKECSQFSTLFECLIESSLDSGHVSNAHGDHAQRNLGSILSMLQDKRHHSLHLS